MRGLGEAQTAARNALSGFDSLWRPQVAGIDFPYVTAEEAARLLGLTSKTLANWRSNGDGPRFYRPSPKLVLYAVEDLNAWVERDGPRFSAAKR